MSSDDCVKWFKNLRAMRAMRAMRVCVAIATIARLAWGIAHWYLVMHIQQQQKQGILQDNSRF